MLFDFKETYTAYSNEALIAIIAHPDSYQPEAVDAARDLLHSRGITEEELQVILYPPKANTSASHIPYTDGDTTIFEELEAKALPASVKAKIKIISIWLGVTATYSLTTWLFRIIKYNNSETQYIYSLTFLTLLIISVPYLYIYLFRRRNPWSRSLAIAYSLFILADTAITFYRAVNSDYYNYYDPLGKKILIGWNLYILAMHGTVIMLGLQKDFRVAFPLSRKIIGQTALVTILIFFLELYLRYASAENF